MRNVALAKTDISSDEESPVDVAEHGPAALLMQCLRTTRQHLALAIHAMREAGTLVEEDEWAQQRAQLERIANSVEERCAQLELGQRSFLLPEQFQQFAKLLKQRRESLHLTQRELSKRAGLCERTIKNIERLEVSPSRDTVVRLIEVEELNLSWADVLTEPAKQTADSSSDNYNCYVPPGYEPLRMVQQLQRVLNGPGGHIEQTNAYLEHRSAIAFVAMGHEPSYVARFRSVFPVAECARRVLAETGQVPLRVIALGPGDGHLEVRFVQHLLGEAQNPDIELLLFDISQPLLNSAYQHALDTFGEQSPVHTLMMQGNFHDLARYPQVVYAPPKGRRRRVYTMFGNTLANLDNELRFFQHCMSHCQPGDLLLLDVRSRQAPLGCTEEDILRLDPAFQGAFHKAHAEWLSTPIRMHCQDLTSCDFKMELETQCSIPGSYALDAVATVKARNQSDRRFSMFRFKSYDEGLLIKTLSRFGWECLLSLPIGPQEHAPLALLLQKRDAQKN